MTLNEWVFDGAIWEERAIVRLEEGKEAERDERKMMTLKKKQKLSQWWGKPAIRRHMSQKVG
ncbi:hypothetical protein MJO28_000592 [Puccinia striiformis f. sp. tritici]|uniref:Uncharacterized protein n=1 Tax=Puccinia striiformis f. sp. tritici TaxID=168172 RepID=A0ACC0F158_9BASI|nr:hypothetical protein MJO28_000592 [Puccinia striiformis f. sp. tritici]